MGAGSLPLKLGGFYKGTENSRQESGEGCLWGVFSSKTARHCWAVWERAAFTSVFVKHSASACQLVNLGSPLEGPHIQTMPFYSVWLGGRVVSPASSIETFLIMRSMGTLPNQAWPPFPSWYSGQAQFSLTPWSGSTIIPLNGALQTRSSLVGNEVALLGHH